MSALAGWARWLPDLCADLRVKGGQQDQHLSYARPSHLREETCNFPNPIHIGGGENDNFGSVENLVNPGV